MSEQERGSPFVSFLAGIGFGALVGAGLALLLAPQSGRETREDLQEVAGRTEERVKNLTGRVREHGGKFLETQKGSLTRAWQAGREAAAEKRRQLLERTKKEETGDERP